MTTNDILTAHVRHAMIIGILESLIDRPDGFPEPLERHLHTHPAAHLLWEG